MQSFPFSSLISNFFLASWPLPPVPPPKKKAERGEGPQDQLDSLTKLISTNKVAFKTFLPGSTRWGRNGLAPVEKDHLLPLC